jgi:hypothetical protein
MFIAFHADGKSSQRVHSHCFEAAAVKVWLVATSGRKLTRRRNLKLIRTHVFSGVDKRSGARAM